MQRPANETKISWTHTPGPWIDGFCHWGLSDVYVMGGDGSVCVNGSPVTYIAKQVSLRNGRLIAAAPDLYEALKALYAATPDNEGDDLGAACRTARAALAKVESL